MKYKKDDEVLEIVQEDSPESPREWDNVGTMACFHPDYTLGDKQDEISKDDYTSWDHMEAELNKRAEIVIRLRLYDHSGVSISASTGHPYSCQWDSMTVGFIYVTAEELRKNYVCKRITKKILAKARAMMLSEIKTYNQYLTGDVWGFRKYTIKTCENCLHEEEEEVDSCYGFYGTDFKENGLLEHAEIKKLEEWEVIEE